jgi:hypothetical protein
MRYTWLPMPFYDQSDRIQLCCFFVALKVRPSSASSGTLLDCCPEAGCIQALSSHRLAILLGDAAAIGDALPMASGDGPGA